MATKAKFLALYKKLNADIHNTSDLDLNGLTNSTAALMREWWFTAPFGSPILDAYRHHLSNLSNGTDFTLVFQYVEPDHYQKMIYNHIKKMTEDSLYSPVSMLGSRELSVLWDKYIGAVLILFYMLILTHKRSTGRNWLLGARNLLQDKLIEYGIIKSS